MAAILAALTAKAPRPLKFYFGAQLFNTLLVELAYNHVSKETYAAIYAVGMVILVLAMVEIVWSSVKNWWIIALSTSFSMLCCYGVYTVIGHMSIGSWIVLIEGGALTACGTALALKTPFYKPWKVAATLVILWFILAMFDFGWVLNRLNEFWNLWLPISALTIAMAYLARILREVPAS